jgi:flavin reductase (DIM6/NTAB) family NADH-FMN oxidoreductase RutF
VTEAFVARRASVTGGEVTAEEFRRGLARHAAGVVVVTAAAPSGPAGLTATSFTSVSLDPPLVSFYVALSSTTLLELRKSPGFAVNVLGHDQSDVADRFAARDVDRFAAPTRWRPGPAGEPFLDGASAQIVCDWHTTSQIGDHLLIVGRVTAIELGAAAHPLLYHRGRFGHFQPQP